MLSTAQRDRQQAADHAHEWLSGVPAGMSHNPGIFQLRMAWKWGALQPALGLSCKPEEKRGAGHTDGKQETPQRAFANHLNFLRETGAGEGIRTLDPNLGKVVLYP